MLLFIFSKSFLLNIIKHTDLVDLDYFF